MNLPHTSSQQADNFTFLATREYFEQLIKDIDETTSGERILLATMTFAVNEAPLKQLVQSLLAAAKRDVSICLQVDAHTFLIHDNQFGPLWWHKEIREPLKGVFKQAYGAIKQLEQAGVQVVMTNMPKRIWTSPFVGRSHIKASIVGDTIYLGGCNLSDLHLDAMARWEDKQTADWLHDLLMKRAKQSQTILALGDQDIRHSIDDTHEILLDVGVKKQSIIYDEALTLIDNAKEWLVITCQFFPNSTTAKHLKKAYDRGVKVYPIFNNASVHAPSRRPIQYAVIKQEQLRNPSSFFETMTPKGSTYLHAKILASESDTLIGSHNYVTAGVNFGTAEIALRVMNPDFSRNLVKLIVDEVGMTQKESLRAITAS